MKKQQWFCSTPNPQPEISSLPDNKMASRSLEALGPKGKFWPTGKVFKIGFIGGTTAQRSWPIAAFAEWAKYANLTFTFPVSGPHDIRIAFNTGGGAWSYIGTDCSMVGQAYPTMNLGWTGLDVALHEIGHSLGLAHEQSSPVGGICFDHAVVDAALKGPPNYWTQEMIDFNVYFKYAAADVFATNWDGTSIMEYSFPASWTCNKVAISGGTVLSPLDKIFIATRYPGVVIPPTTITLTIAQRDAIMAAMNAGKAAVDNALQVVKTAFGV